VEPGEEPAQALVRELREELSVDAYVVGQVPGPLDGDWPLDDTSVLRVMRVRLERGEPKPGVAHDEIRWLAGDEIGSVAWLAADVAPATAASLRLDTWVDFPAGATEGDGLVTLVVPLPRVAFGEHETAGPDGRVAVVVDRTPFHPLDHGWPDQPGDTGTLSLVPHGATSGGSARRTVTVRDCLTGALDDDGRLQVHADIDVRRGDPSRTWVVVHVLDAADAPAIGDRVHLAVDAARRTALSRGHSACHLAALALNEVTARFWTKEPPRRDSRGFPYLDQIAIQTSRISPGASYDAYRCGKSLRKAGFDAEAFLADTHAVTDAADALLDAWVATAAPSRVDTDGDPTLSARRRWWCDVPGGPAVIPCGGTHVSDLGVLERVRTALTRTETGFEVRTTAG
jgi:alanyl-tRNA synthetase